MVQYKTFFQNKWKWTQVRHWFCVVLLMEGKCLLYNSALQNIVQPDKQGQTLYTRFTN